MLNLFDNRIERWREFALHMYPGGLAFPSEQHRDLARTFFAGVFELALAIEDVKLVAELTPHLRKMTDLNWWPDDRFKV